MAISLVSFNKQSFIQSLKQIDNVVYLPLSYNRRASKMLADKLVTEMTGMLKSKRKKHTLNPVKS